MAKRTVIANGRVVDPAQGLDEVRSVVLEGEVVKDLLKRPPSKADTLVDARGMLVTPGFIDLHVHLREPGHEYKEDVASGAMAAVAGGFTTIVSMPNTDPVNDSPTVTELILDRARRARLCRVLPAGAVTVGLKGEALAEMGLLAQAGCVIFTDDGKPVMSASVMRRALEYAKGLGLAVMVHEEDLTLSKGGAMHEGEHSTTLGLKGIPSAAEDVMVVRDIALLETTGGHLHVAHLSTEGAARAVRAAKKRKLKVTCEVTPHHFSLTDEAVASYDTSTKMAPPLRASADRKALLKALRDGTVDAIATDHAPHSAVEKDLEYPAAANGVVGLETAAALTLKLVLEGELPLLRAIELLTSGPAGVLGLETGTLLPGRPADLTIVDLDEAWDVDPKRFYSKSRNTPFAGWRLQGRVKSTWVAGRKVYQDRGGAA
ncbi:MAG: dihydroorotase [Deltaproteobacteria bacterium]|nr:dihydroorotase [Deltaproteobacteria bacterium]